jgi:urease accessory protein
LRLSAIHAESLCYFCRSLFDQGWILQAIKDYHLTHLRFWQLTDSALPIGSAAHSFGLETLVAEGLLTVPQLASFFNDYLVEAGAIEGAFCRAAYRLWGIRADGAFEAAWISLNQNLSALKTARESRTASLLIGKRFMQLVTSLTNHPRLEVVLRLNREADVEIHHAIAVGLAGAGLGVDETVAVLGYLQQTMAGLVSACQRLMPLGQQQAAQLMWQLKPVMIEAAERSASDDPLDAVGGFFTPLLDLAAMRHATLPTRLFIS